MEKIEALEQIAKIYLEAAKTKDEIDTATKLHNAIDEVKKEESALVSENAKMVSAYKQVIRDTAFAPAPSPKKAQAKSFEEALKDIKASRKEK